MLPVWAEVETHLVSPLSIYHALARPGRSFLLESSEMDSASGRFSVIGLDADALFAHMDGDWQQDVPNGQSPNPLVRIEEHVAARRVPADWPVPPCGARLGLYGYLGYDSVRWMEPCLAGQAPPDRRRVPDIALMDVRELVIIDHKYGRVYCMVRAEPEEGEDWDHCQKRLAEMREKLAQAGVPQGLIPPADPLQEDAFQSEYGREAYEHDIESIKSSIRAGDVYQVVLAQHLSAPFSEEPLQLYRAVRAVNPSPYMYFLDFGDYQLAGASPETLCKVNGRLAEVRPIAATRRRGRTPDEDLALEQDMRSDAKEVAEHVMLVDLGRNDLGRVATIGSVQVLEYLQVHRYRQVMHMVSTVQGRLRDDVGAMDLVRATFPAGTLSGAPKIAAMQMIDALEPCKRGPYGGGVGYFGYDGNMDLAICIRTALIKQGVLHVAAGGGIVVDSVPALEWKETLNKARAIFRATRRVQGTTGNLA